ncbi:sugar ABC transporter substrate-binding protein [Lachnoclostridium phytofermentans]|uniref:Maltodextrin-binding protein n=1 Tax=Lachnoclostridium phytofermentans (strain ATCC 700394 / DSM 18823 / ISDg) TaxID=357809 RepID=A9KKT7_LACP7|nr:maltose ABC transporter substrate-binding protein [Lachnoclostridium phytofermentans]ABX42669.1 extracellular solute-binding protein family 1 [Lachnoclostridium phytofermentans ISDg]
MKKKVLALLITTTMVFSMVGCGSKGKDVSNSTTPSPTPQSEKKQAESNSNQGGEEKKISGDLLVWLDNDDWADAVIEAFNAKYPDVTIEYQNVGNVDTRGKVSLDGPAGIGPDVFLMPHDHMGIAIEDGLCEPMTDELQKKYENNILDAALETCTADGKVYGVPISTENIALFYNKDLYGENPPSSFEEIIEFAKGYNDFAAGKYTMAWQVDDAYHNYLFLTAFGMQLFGPDMRDYKTPGWDTPQVTEAIDFYRSLRKQLFDVNVVDASWDATVAAFQRGEVPLTISGPWAISDALTNGVNFGVTKLPTIKGVQPRCFSGNIIASVSSYAKNKEAAYAFVDFLAGEEGATIMYKVTGKMTALKDISNIAGLKEDVYLKGIQEQSPYADPMPIIPEMSQAWDAIKNLFTFTWDNTLTSKEAQDKAMDTYKTALQAAGKTLD